MTEVTCRWVASDMPRVVAGRHDAACEDSELCRGCLPCPEAHCRACGREHAEHACPTCISGAREAIGDIRRLCRALPAEVEHKGIESEAMNLLGPAADPERTGHVAASIAVGRIPADWLEVADNELHPLIVLGGWQEVYIEAFEHEDPSRITIEGAASYLDRNLAYAATWPHVPFEDLTRDLRACRAHLEGVLHDGEQVETGAPCMTCETPLRREWGTLAAADGWRCPRCREWRSESEYRLNVLHLHRENADWLTAQEMELRTGIRAGTVRKWSERGAVAHRRDSGRLVFSVEEVEAEAKRRGHIA